MKNRSPILTRRPTTLGPPLPYLQYQSPTTPQGSCPHFHTMTQILDSKDSSKISTQTSATPSTNVSVQTWPLDHQKFVGNSLLNDLLTYLIQTNVLLVFVECGRSTSELQYRHCWNALPFVTRLPRPTLHRNHQIPRPAHH